MSAWVIVFAVVGGLGLLGMGFLAIACCMVGGRADEEMENMTKWNWVGEEKKMCEMHHCEMYFGELRPINSDEVSGQPVFDWICPKCCEEWRKEMNMVYGGGKKKSGL